MGRIPKYDHIDISNDPTTKTEFLSVSEKGCCDHKKVRICAGKSASAFCWDFASRNHRTFWGPQKPWRDSPKLYRYWPVLLNPSSFCGAHHLNTLHSNQRWHRKKTLKEVDCNLSRSIFNQSNLIPMGPPFSNQPAPLAGWTRTHPCIAQSWSCAHCSWASRFPTHCSYAVAGANLENLPAFGGNLDRWCQIQRCSREFTQV